CGRTLHGAEAPLVDGAADGLDQREHAGQPTRVEIDRERERDGLVTRRHLQAVCQRLIAAGLVGVPPGAVEEGALGQAAPSCIGDLARKAGATGFVQYRRLLSRAVLSNELPIPEALCVDALALGRRDVALGRQDLVVAPDRGALDE